MVSLAMFATIAYTIISFQYLTNTGISYVSGVLITVTGILLGFSGLTPLSKSLERLKLQATLTITTILWLVAIVMLAQTPLTFTPDIVSYSIRSLFLVGVVLFIILVIMYSTSIVEATKQRLLREQAASSQTAKTGSNL